MSFFPIGWAELVMVLVVILIAFHVGRRVGQHQGARNSLARLPLILREQAIRQEKCPICDAEK